MKKFFSKSIALVMACIMLLSVVPMNIYAAESYVSEPAVTVDTINDAVATLNSVSSYFKGSKVSFLAKNLVSDDDMEKIDDTTEILSDAVVYLSGDDTSADSDLSESDVNTLKEVAVLFEEIALYLNTVDYTSLKGYILREILPDNAAEEMREAAAALKTLSTYLEKNDLDAIGTNIKNEVSVETNFTRIKQFLLFIKKTLTEIIGVLTHFNLQENGLAGYLYDPAEKCFYTASDPWQRAMAYTLVYDGASPLVWINFDTVRLKFDYAGENWMIQVWKGQYGMVFYGAEIGVYTKPVERNFGIYDCADDEHLLKMSMDLYEYETGFLKKPSWEKKFSRPYGDYWWCTGFLPGNKLGEFENLRLTARITMKDYDMLEAFTGALQNQVISYETDGLDVIFSY